jgi:hypothetical protein
LSIFTTWNFCVNGTLDAKGMTSLGRNWCSWEENILFNLEEMGRKVVDRINLAMDWDEWHALVDMSQDIRFHKRQEIS